MSEQALQNEYDTLWAQVWFGDRVNIQTRIRRGKRLAELRDALDRIQERQNYNYSN